MNDVRSLAKLSSVVLQGCGRIDLDELETIPTTPPQTDPKKDDTTDDTTNDDPPGCTMWGGISAFG